MMAPFILLSFSGMNTHDLIALKSSNILLFP